MKLPGRVFVDTSFFVALLNSSDADHALALSLQNEARVQRIRSPDKEWGLTDCSSFVVMQELNLKAVLSADHHFRQAGYQALLLDPPGNSN